MDTSNSEKLKIHGKISHDEQGLLSVARKSLTEFLGREPTRQELRRVHLCFKRMAFTLIDYVDHQNYEERKNSQNQGSKLK